MNNASDPLQFDRQAALRIGGGLCLLAVALGLVSFGVVAGAPGSAADPPASDKDQVKEPLKEPSIGGIPLFAAWPQNQKPDAAIVLSGETYGFFQPCGCSRPQKGGLERRAQFIQSLKDKGWPVVGVDLGDIYPETAAIQDQGLLKYKMMMNALSKMGYIAIGVGKNEFKVEIQKLLAEYALQKQLPPFLLAGNVLGNLNGKPQPREERFQNPGVARPLIDVAECTNVGTVPLGVVGIVGKSTSEEINKANFDSSIMFGDNRTVLQKAVNDLSANPKKPELNILLFQGTSTEAKMLAKDWPQFQVILCQAEDSEPPQFPTEVAHASGQKTLVIQVGHKGRYVGVLGVFKKAGG